MTYGHAGFVEAASFDAMKAARDAAIARAEAAEAKVAAVEALHRHNGRHGCATCLDVDGFPHPWPCDTAFALATEATP